MVVETKLLTNDAETIKRTSFISRFFQGNNNVFANSGIHTPIQIFSSS